jgi:hypothetical protein
MSSKTASRWKQMQDADSQQIEKALRIEFPDADAYRYNSASVRVRIIDDKFRGKPADKRDALVERVLKNLPTNLQAEIMNLTMLYPGEVNVSLAAKLANDEFEDPTPSRL